MNPNTGCGHVFPRPDGVKARCGGPALGCKACVADLATQRAGHGPKPGDFPRPQPGRTMRPTEALRFVERTQDQGDGTARRIRVLQQGWAPVHGGGLIEWQDVPLVVEP